MNTIRFTSKAAFIDALEGRRQFWRDQDAKRAREHKAAEQAWLKGKKAQLRAALKFDYEQMRDAASRYHGVFDGDTAAPRCPELMEAKIDRVIAAVQVTQAIRFTVDTNTGPWKTAHSLLTHDPDAKTTVC